MNKSQPFKEVVQHSCSAQSCFKYLTTTSPFILLFGSFLFLYRDDGMRFEVRDTVLQSLGLRHYFNWHKMFEELAVKLQIHIAN